MMFSVQLSVSKVVLILLFFNLLCMCVGVCDGGNVFSASVLCQALMTGTIASNLNAYRLDAQRYQINSMGDIQEFVLPSQFSCLLFLLHFRSAAWETNIETVSTAISPRIPVIWFVWLGQFIFISLH